MVDANAAIEDMATVVAMAMATIAADQIDRIRAKTITVVAMVDMVDTANVVIMNTRR